MKVLIDMNLSPTWVNSFKNAGIEAIHWSQVGAANATDMEIFNWAIKNNYMVFTHDLDFGTLLAANKTNCPSVIQIRSQDVTPEKISNTIISVLNKFSENIENGALITIDENKSRVRILPIK
jgi:predicted nuclease of predicted toxin-antitoxin system